MQSQCTANALTESYPGAFYNRAKADNKVPGSHKSMKTKLSEEVVAKIMPVYQRLASNEILLRCVSGKTQNANESLHSCIWRKCPNDVFVSKKRIDLAVTAAVSEVNIGYVETLKLNNTEMILQKDLVGMYPVCVIFNSSGPGEGVTSRKLWSNYTRVTTDREERLIHCTAQEHRSGTTCHGSLVVMAGMSRVQAKYPPCRGTMHIKSVEFKRPPIGVVVRRGEFQLRCRP
ncbi:uncharacterized protein TNCV_4239431 [Trichonephila clavipes]|nr:uncharacterized protein TNCV_4239431 [Trichonephila clavipes]